MGYLIFAVGIELAAESKVHYYISVCNLSSYVTIHIYHLSKYKLDHSKRALTDLTLAGQSLRDDEGEGLSYVSYSYKTWSNRLS